MGTTYSLHLYVQYIKDGYDSDMNNYVAKLMIL